MDLKNHYHIEKILYLAPRPAKHSENLIFRLGNESIYNSVNNPVIYEHPGSVRQSYILVIKNELNFAGQYLSISSNTSTYFGIAAIQVITKEDLEVN